MQIQIHFSGALDSVSFSPRYGQHREPGRQCLRGRHLASAAGGPPEHRAPGAGMPRLPGAADHSRGTGGGYCPTEDCLLAECAPLLVGFFIQVRSE